MLYFPGLSAKPKKSLQDRIVKAIPIPCPHPGLPPRPPRPMPRPNAFTILEMMVVLLVVAVLLMITLPNIQQKEGVIRQKGCEALLEVVNSQIMLYEIEHDETPQDIRTLITGGYLKESQAACPNGEVIRIQDGQAVR